MEYGHKINDDSHIATTQSSWDSLATSLWDSYNKYKQNKINVYTTTKGSVSLDITHAKPTPQKYFMDSWGFSTASCTQRKTTNQCSWITL